MRKVKIVGAGMAGMSAALRLLERGYHVTLYEQDEFVGGMLRAFDDPTTETRREHSYHMFMNWYYNFWAIAEELGIDDNFEPREAFRFLYKDEFHDMPELLNPGGPQDMFRNLESGAASPADLFLFMYSMVDLLATPIDRDHFLDQYSVNAFLRSRPYMTEGCAMLHQKVWYTVWSIASFQASAKSYREFLKYGNRVPVPQLWVLKGDKQSMILDPWMTKLKSFGENFVHCPLHRLVELEPTGDGRLGSLTFQTVTKSPSVYPRAGAPGSGVGEGEPVGWEPDGECVVDVSDDDVILAVTPGMMAELVTGDIYNADPKLGDIRYLQAEPMGTCALHLTSKHKGFPDDVTVFMDTPYQMTFLDYSQMWTDLDHTVLYLTVSDVVSLLSIPTEQRDANKNLVLDLKKPKTAIDYILKEALENIPVKPSDIDLRKTSLEMNTGEELFANLVGSWDKRPVTKTKLHNLFLAGTYVRNFADVSTIEGAVASGLNAAEAVRLHNGGHGKKIETIVPDFYPPELFMGLKAAWAPYAAAAKVMSEAEGIAGIDSREFVRRLGIDRLIPTPDLPDSLGTLFWDFLPRSWWSDKNAARRGPLFANYDASGRRRSRRTGTSRYHGRSRY